MQLNIQPNCPLDNFAPCRQLQCGWFTQLRGKDPQSEKELDEYGCAIAWLPILLIENAQQQRQTAAAVESFRNKVVDNQEQLLLSSKTSIENVAKDSPRLIPLKNL